MHPKNQHNGISCPSAAPSQDHMQARIIPNCTFSSHKKTGKHKVCGACSFALLSPLLYFATEWKDGPERPRGREERPFVEKLQQQQICISILFPPPSSIPATPSLPPPEKSFFHSPYQFKERKFSISEMRGRESRKDPSNFFRPESISGAIKRFVCQIGTLW